MAANSRSLKAGKAFIEFSLSDGKVRDQLKRLQKRFAAVGAGLQRMGGIGVAVSGAITGAFASTVGIFTSVGDNLDKMAQRTGFSVESLSELGFAAEQSGSDLKTLEGGIKGLQTVMRNAERGSARAVDNLAAIGLTYQQLKDLSPEAQLKLVADHLAKIEDPSKRAALAMQLLGGSGQKLLPFLANGSAGMEKLQAEARGLGLTIDGETAASAAALADKMNILKKVLTRAAVAIGESLSPMLQDLADWITQNVGGMIGWVKINRDAIATFAKWAAILGAGGAALIAVGSALNVASVGLGALNVALGCLLANPIVAALALVAAGIGFIAFEALRASDGIAGIDAAIKKLDSSRTTGNADDLRAMTTRFEQLAAKTKLSSEEQKEARKIITELRTEYGDLAAFVDTASGKIVKVQKTLAQLRAAQGGRSSLSLKTQIGLEELAISSLKAEGAAVDELAKREERLAKLREKLKLTDSIVGDAKPFDVPEAVTPVTNTDTTTTTDEITPDDAIAKEGGEELASAFIDFVSAKASFISKKFGEGIQAAADGVDAVAAAIETAVAAKEGMDQANQAINPVNNQSLGGTFSGIQAQFGSVDGEQNKILTQIARSNAMMLEKMGEGGMPVA